MDAIKAFDMVYDRWIDNEPLPNLVEDDVILSDLTHLRHQFPYTTKCSVERWCKEQDYPLNRYRLDQGYPAPSFYPVELHHFDINIDYFGLMSAQVHEHLCRGRLLVVFFCWHNVDVKQMYELLLAGAQKHGLAENCYRVVVNNGLAGPDTVPWFYYFADAELDFWQQDQSCRPSIVTPEPRNKDFSVLCRQHRSWTALVMTQFDKSQLLENSYWSYPQDVNNDVHPSPLDVDRIPDVTQPEIDAFLAGISNHMHHDMAAAAGDGFVRQHFDDSHVHVVIESTIDARRDAWLSGEIFQPIKHGKPFVVLGSQHCLLKLRYLGYRVFDDVIPTDYDDESDNHKRYLMLYRTLRDIKNRGASEVFELCRDDIVHNQQMFIDSKASRLHSLHSRLIFHYLYCNNDYGRTLPEEVFKLWYHK